MSEFEEAVERVVAGLEKKNRLINPKEREILDRGAALLLEKEKIEGEELKRLDGCNFVEAIRKPEGISLNIFGDTQFFGVPVQLIPLVATHWNGGSMLHFANCCQAAM